MGIWVDEESYQYNFNNHRQGYDYDDLLLVPTTSFVESRDDVDLSTYLLGKRSTLHLSLPVIGSPMKGIMSKELAYELHKAGGIGILHRFYSSLDEKINDMSWLKEMGARFGVAIGLNDEEGLKLALEIGADIICVDVANGYLNSVVNYCEYVADTIEKTESHTLLMAGNVVDGLGSERLYLAGVDLVRVGIGSGKLCITRNVTGVGYPQLSAVSLASSADGGYVIADGGIRNSGDAMKAIAAGANAVMVGSLLAKTFESAHNGIISGMASRALQEEYYHGVKSVEGISENAEKYVSAKDLLSEFSYGLKSACTYLDLDSLSDIHKTKQVEWVTTGHGTLKQL